MELCPSNTAGKGQRYFEASEICDQHAKPANEARNHVVEKVVLKQWEKMALD
jgi:hypothetical protein